MSQVVSHKQHAGRSVGWPCDVSCRPVRRAIVIKSTALDAVKMISHRQRGAEEIGANRGYPVKTIPSCTASFTAAVL